MTGKSNNSGFTIRIQHIYGTINTRPSPQAGTSHQEEPCAQYVERERDLDTFGQVLEQSSCALRGMMEERDRLYTQLQQAQADLLICNSRLSIPGPHHRRGIIPTMGLMVAGVSPYNRDRMLSGLEHAKRRVADLVQERDNWILEKNKMISSYNTELVKYKDEVNYAQGAGNNVFIAQTEVDDLKAKIRTPQRENQALIEAGMQTRQALAAEMDIRSEK